MSGFQQQQVKDAFMSTKKNHFIDSKFVSPLNGQPQRRPLNSLVPQLRTALFSHMTNLLTAANGVDGTKIPIDYTQQAAQNTHTHTHRRRVGDEKVVATSRAAQAWLMVGCRARRDAV
jgi:hypothetical protein